MANAISKTAPATAPEVKSDTDSPYATRRRPPGLRQLVHPPLADGSPFFLAAGTSPHHLTEPSEDGAAYDRGDNAKRRPAGRSASIVRPWKPESPLNRRAKHKQRAGRHDDNEQCPAAIPGGMKKNKNGGRSQHREGAVYPGRAGHSPAVVSNPVLDSTNGPCPSVLTSAMCRRDDGQRPPNYGKNSGNRACGSEQDHPEPRHGAGLNVEVGDAHGKEAIGQGRWSFPTGPPPAEIPCASAAVASARPWWPDTLSTTAEPVRLNVHHCRAMIAMIVRSVDTAPMIIPAIASPFPRSPVFPICTSAATETATPPMLMKNASTNPKSAMELSFSVASVPGTRSSLPGL